MSLEEGIFILSRTITNPKPDRRVRDQWCKAVEWQKGWRFVVRRSRMIERERAEALKDAKVAVESSLRIFEVTYLGERYARSVTVYERDGIVAEVRGDVSEAAEPAAINLVNALVLSTDEDDALDWIFRQRGTRMSDCANGVLHRLVHRGTVKLDDIRAVMAEEDAEEDAANGAGS